MTTHSLDPRVNRAWPLPQQDQHPDAPAGDQFQTWQVFHQSHRGEQHMHVGIVHAPTAEMALLFAKEQYARRFQCVNLWVVRSADVFASEYEDDDMFQPAHDKSYREASSYRNREKIEDFLAGADKIVHVKKDYAGLATAFENPTTIQSKAVSSAAPANTVTPRRVEGEVLIVKKAILVGVATPPREITAKILK
jgi:ring-1,2-phenylacetyl-CoA epoxidase subunit PaaB